jgi:hypothetical protein
VRSETFRQRHICFASGGEKLKALKQKPKKLQNRCVVIISFSTFDKAENCAKGSLGLKVGRDTIINSGYKRAKLLDRRIRPWKNYSLRSIFSSQINVSTAMVINSIFSKINNYYMVT